MRIGLVAPPFIAVPPARYGGTELFIADLASELHARGHDVTVYANGDSHVPCRLKSRFARADWPILCATQADLKRLDHLAWAIHDAASTVDVLHLNDVQGVAFTHLTELPVVLTVHHPPDRVLSEYYARFPRVEYVVIAGWLAQAEPMPRLHVVHHGIPLHAYACSAVKQDFAVFLGRLVPDKGPHLAIEAARRAGIRLKLAGEVQPASKDYWERQVAPHVDGHQIEYVGAVDHRGKTALLAAARALVFPIQWQEPFGLVMIEAMACGTPVLAFRGGAVEEIVRDGINGWICRDVADMAARLAGPLPAAAACREWVADHFSVGRMADGYLQVYERAVCRSNDGRCRLSDR